MIQNFTNKQIIFMMYCITTGYGVINIPKSAVQAGGTTGWVSLALATLLFILITYVICYLQFTYNGKTIYEYGIDLIGKYLTVTFLLIYLVYFFIYFTFITRQYCETLKIFLLPKTSWKYLLILFLAVVYYALNKGINSISRICEIYGIISIIGFILINIVLSTQGDVINIYPLFEKDNFMTYLKGISIMMLPLMGSEILLLVPFNGINNKSIYRYMILMTVFIFLMYFFIIETNILLVDVSGLLVTNFTIFNIIRGVDIEFLEIFKRLDGIYLIIWTTKAVCSSSLLGYGCVTIIKKIFKKIKYKYIIGFAIIMAYYVASIPKNTQQVEQIVMYNSILGYFMVFIVPIILFVVSKVKNAKVK